MATVAQRLLSDRLRFPGMLPDEIVVYKAWLVLHEKEYDSFDFNVRIGEGEDPGPTFSDVVREKTIQDTKLRIDVVATKAGRPEIQEVKRRATPANLGQLITYFHVWNKQGLSVVAPALRLICNAFSPEILPAVKETGIVLDVVAADFSILRTAGIPGTRRFTGRA